MPLHVASASICEDLIEICVGDIVDCQKNGYVIIIIYAKGLPQSGVWLESLSAHFGRLGKELPPVVTISINASPDEADLLEKALSSVT